MTLPSFTRSAWAMAVLACLLTGCSEDGPLFPGNEAPAADAGVDRLVEAGGQTELDGSRSVDADGEALDYAWSLVSGPVWVAIADADEVTAQVTLPAAGEYVFRLTVTDASGATDRDDVRVFVTTAQPEPQNTAPTAHAGSDGQTAVGLEFILDGSASADPDGDELVFAWVQVAGPAVAVVEGDQSRARVMPPEEGDYIFRLTVIDARGGSSQDEVRISVSQPVAPNGKPSADVGSDVVLFAGDTADLDGTASTDPDGDPLSYSWIQLSGPAPVPILSAAQVVAHVTPTVPGVYVFRLTVADAQGASAEGQLQVTVRPATGTIEIEAVFGGSDDG